jgi:molybdopterin-containing oxidoreductase family iron-sulfur binding subunit
VQQPSKPDRRALIEAIAARAPDRRRFLQLMTASMSLMGLGSCGPEVLPRERVPYVEQPEGIIPGRSRYFATATPLGGYGTGVLIEHQMGRPIKVEGNPDHSASLGLTSAIDQARILGLYDPYRAEAVAQGGQITSREAFATAALGRREALLARHGDGLAILTGTVTSPTLAAQIGALRQQYPQLRWHQWEVVNLLHPAHPDRHDRRRPREPRHPRRRGRDGVSAGLSDRRDRLRGRQRCQQPGR